MRCLRKGKLSWELHCSGKYINRDCMSTLWRNGRQRSIDLWTKLKWYETAVTYMTKECKFVRKTHLIKSAFDILYAKSFRLRTSTSVTDIGLCWGSKSFPRWLLHLIHVPYCATLIIFSPAKRLKVFQSFDNFARQIVFLTLSWSQ